MSQKPGESPGEGLLPTCAMSLEASAILLKSLGATGLVSPAAEALAKKNPAIQASAKQLAEAGKKMHPTLNQVCRALLRFLLGGEGIGVTHVFGAFR